MNGMGTPQNTVGLHSSHLMLRLFSHLFCLILCLHTNLAFCDGTKADAAPMHRFEAGNQQYAQGNWSAALVEYESIAKTGPVSANLFLNLGNTHFQLGNFGLAALFFDRALQLEPEHAQARLNLQSALDKAGTPFQPESKFKIIFRRCSRMLPNIHWLTLMSVCFWTAVGSVFGLRWGSSKPPLWIALSLAVSGFVFCLATLQHLRSESRRAVVIVPQSAALTAPADRSPPILSLTAGASVHILSLRGPWTFCELSGDTKGWIPTVHLQALYPAQ
jgi:hypothetical protein